MVKKGKLYELFVEASTDAHVGWFLWETAQAEMDFALGRPCREVTHTLEFSECKKITCAERRRMMKDYD
jgi:hypothetical protein